MATYTSRPTAKIGAWLSGVFLLVACDHVVPRGPAPPSPTASSGATAAATAATAAEPSFCVDSTFRQSDLVAAWPEGDRIVVCVRQPSPDDDGAAPQRCLGVRAPGEYGAAPDAVPAERRLDSAPFRSVSRDGRFRFEILGGAHGPHRATGILQDARTGRVVKRAPIRYDEHVELEGWIGQSVVLRTSVDEGPGCALTWVDPGRSWPISMVSDDEDAGARSLGCFGGNLVLRPSEGTFVIVDASGSEVAFIDEATMNTDVVVTGRLSFEESGGRRQVRWMESDDVLAIAYGPGDSGVVARIDIRQRKLLSVWAPPECPGSSRRVQAPGDGGA